MSTESLSKGHKPLIERAGLAAFWNVAFFPLKVLLPFIASVITVRLLATDGFALLAVSTGLLNNFGLVSDLGIERTLPRFYPEIEMRYGRRGVVQMLKWVTLIKAGVLLPLIVLIAALPNFWISSFALGPQGNALLAMIAVLLVLGALSDVSIQLLYTHFRQKVTNALDLLAVFVLPVLTSAFVYFGWGAPGALMALLIVTAISVAFSVPQAWRMLSRLDAEPRRESSSVKLPSSRSLRQRLVSFAALNYLINWTVYLYDLPFLLTAITLIVVAPSDKRVDLAIIALAYKFTKQFLRALVVPLTGVQTPLFARLYAEGRIDGLRTAYATLTKFLILALLPSAVGLIVLSRNILQIVYGQKGAEKVVTQFTMPEVVACTVILAVGLFGEAMISVVLSVLMVYEDYRSIITARLTALVSIPLLLLLVPGMGVVGAAISASVAALASRITALVFARNRLGLAFPGAFFVRVGIASAVMGAVLLPFLAYLPPDLPSTAAMIAVGGPVFYAGFRLLGGIDRADKERLSSMKIPFIKTILRFV